MGFTDGSAILTTLFGFNPRVSSADDATAPTDSYFLALSQRDGGYEGDFTNLGKRWLGGASLASPLYGGVAIGNCCGSTAPPADVFIDAIVVCQ